MFFGPWLECHHCITSSIYNMGLNHKLRSSASSMHLWCCRVLDMLSTLCQVWWEHCVPSLIATSIFLLCLLRKQTTISPMRYSELRPHQANPLKLLIQSNALPPPRPPPPVGSIRMDLYSPFDVYPNIKKRYKSSSRKIFRVVCMVFLLFGAVKFHSCNSIGMYLSLCYLLTIYYGPHHDFVPH